jgi:hypothetical protein
MEHGTAPGETRRDPGMETCLFSSLLVVDEFSPHTSDTSGDEDRMVGCVGVTGVCLLNSVPGWYRHSHFVLSFFLPRRVHGAWCRGVLIISLR